MNPILSVENVKKIYRSKPLFQPVSSTEAVSNVSLSLQPGETLAIVGESGCGKSTLAKLIMGIEPLTAGTILFDGKPRNKMSLTEQRRHVQLIFQDPYGSLNPRKKAWEIISEPLKINFNSSKSECKKRAAELMELVGLRPELSNRYPHMFSGGQRQRIGIARALMLKPKVLLCDEPVSALDVSIQAQILNLLLDLQEELGLSYLFISHDLSVVRHIADRVLVLFYGKVVEMGTVEEIFENPQHEYTRKLLASTPKLIK